MTIKLMVPKGIGSGVPTVWYQWDPVGGPWSNVIVLAEHLAVPAMPESETSVSNEDLGIFAEVSDAGVFRYGRRFRIWHAPGPPPMGEPEYWETAITTVIELAPGEWFQLPFAFDGAIISNDDLFDDWEEVQP